MSVRLRTKVTVQISSQPQPETKDLGDVAQEIVLDSQGEGGSWKVTIPASSTDLLVSLPPVALATFLYLKTRPKVDTDAPVALSIKLNSTSNAPTSVEAPDPSKEGVFMLTHPGISALFVTNAGSIDMVMTIAVVGD